MPQTMIKPVSAVPVYILFLATLNSLSFILIFGLAVEFFGFLDAQL